MDAQALIATAEQQFVLHECPIPDPTPTQLRVRTLYSGVSVGTEFAVIRGKLDWGAFPICTGYQAVGMVEQVGANVERFQPGDKVYYRRNYLPLTLGAQPVNLAAGTHCSVAMMEESAEVAHLPPGVDDATGSLFVMPSVGYNAVNMAGVQMGDVVAVQGVGLIGLGALVAARLRGAITVAIDLNPHRLERAHRLGATHTINSATADVAAALDTIQPGGADVVFEATGIADCLDAAFGLARKHGKFVFLGNYGNASISLHFLVPHGKQLTAFFPCNDGLAPCRAAVLRNIASGAIPWQQTITHRVDAADAPALYAATNRAELPDMLAAVIRWSPV